MGSIRIEQDGDVLVLRRRAGSYRRGRLPAAVAVGLDLWLCDAGHPVSSGSRPSNISSSASRSGPPGPSWPAGSRGCSSAASGCGSGRMASIIARGPSSPCDNGTSRSERSRASPSSRRSSIARAAGPSMASGSRRWAGPYEFGQGVDAAERTRLADLLQKHLQRLSPDRPIPILKDATRSRGRNPGPLEGRARTALGHPLPGPPRSGPHGVRRQGDIQPRPRWACSPS